MAKLFIIYFAAKQVKKCTAARDAHHAHWLMLGLVTFREPKLYQRNLSQRLRFFHNQSRGILLWPRLLPISTTLQKKFWPRA